MTESIIKQLKDYFTKGFRRKLKREDTLKGLIKRMEEKERKLTRKLAEESGEGKARLIRKQLKVLAAQLRKARKKIG